MIARASRDLACDPASVRWHDVNGWSWTARGCDKEARYSLQCHQEFENPARPAYPPIDVCKYVFDGIRADRPAPPPAEAPVANPPR